MAQHKWRNGENSRLGLGSGWGIGLGLGLGIGLGSAFDYFCSCAICVAPNTESPLCAGVGWVSRAMWPNTDKRRLLVKSITGGKPVRADISAFVTCWEQCMCKIWRWHFMWNASNVFSSHESNVQVSAAYNKTDITRAWYRRILVLSWRILSRHIRLIEDMTDVARLILLFMSACQKNCLSTATAMHSRRGPVVQWVVV